MNAAKKLAKKNIKQRQLEAGKAFMQMLNNGKSAKDIGKALGITEQQAARLILQAKQQITGATDDCSASTEVTVNEAKE